MNHAINYTKYPGLIKTVRSLGNGNIKTIMNHGIWWACFIVYELSIFYYSSGSAGSIPKNLLYYILNMGIFYTHLHILNITLGDLPKKRLRLIFYVLAEMTAFLLIKVAADFYFTDFTRVSLSKWYVVKRLGLLDLYRNVFFAGIASLYWTASNISRFERKTKAAEIRQLTIARNNLALEANLARSQNALLRQQINPHLLFNSLNFIHSTVYKVSREAAENVIMLADIMRFGMQEPGPDGRIVLETEVEQLYNLIRINQVRFEQRSAIEFLVSGKTAGHRIIPLVLMTLTENVFKHGDLAGHPATLDLQISETGELRFHTRNRIKVKVPFPRIKSTGLDNIRIRLDFSYPGGYRLETAEHDIFFESTLILQL